MDFLFSGYGLIIISIPFFLAILILGWYRQKEAQDLKSIDLQILSHQNNFSYAENDSALQNSLNYLGLFPGESGKTFNVITKRHEAFDSYIFDASYMIGPGKSKRKVRAIGIAVKFYRAAMPKYEIQKKQRFDSFSRFDKMKKANDKYFPDWMIDRFSVFGHKMDKDKTAQEILSNIDKLYPLITAVDFQLLAGHEQFVVFFQPGELPTDLTGLQQLEEKALVLAQAFSHESSAPKNKVDTEISDEIKMLKQNEKK